MIQTFNLVSVWSSITMIFALLILPSDNDITLYPILVPPGC
jgi:hypothetical protein